MRCIFKQYYTISWCFKQHMKEAPFFLVVEGFDRLINWSVKSEGIILSVCQYVSNIYLNILERPFTPFKIRINGLHAMYK